MMWKQLYIAFFHRILGVVFTLKQFKSGWRLVVRLVCILNNIKLVFEILPVYALNVFQGAINVKHKIKPFALSYFYVLVLYPLKRSVL